LRIETANKASSDVPHIAKENLKNRFTKWAEASSTSPSFAILLNRAAQTDASIEDV